MLKQNLHDRHCFTLYSLSHITSSLRQHTGLGAEEFRAGLGASSSLEIMKAE